MLFANILIEIWIAKQQFWISIVSLSPYENARRPRTHTWAFRCGWKLLSGYRINLFAIFNSIVSNGISQFNKRWNWIGSGIASFIFAAVFVCTVHTVCIWFYELCTRSRALKMFNCFFNPLFPGEWVVCKWEIAEAFCRLPLRYRMLLQTWAMCIKFTSCHQIDAWRAVHAVSLVCIEFMKLKSILIFENGWI